MVVGSVGFGKERQQLTINCPKIRVLVEELLVLEVLATALVHCREPIPQQMGAAQNPVLPPRLL